MNGQSKYPNPSRLAELRTSWLNGNRQAVIADLLSWPESNRAMCGLVCAKFAVHLTPTQRSVFFSMLANRAAE